MKVLHLITGLRRGGAETMLCKLLGATHGSGPEAEVVSLAGPAPMADVIRGLGVKVSCLGLSPGPGAILGLGRLGRLIEASAPDLVQTWMYHANFMGALAAARKGAPPVIWGLRQSNLDPRKSPLGTRVVNWLCARMSRLPARIVCVSESARAVHAAMGYDATRMIVIPNGFDLDAFRPDPAARSEFRAAYGLDACAPLVGLIARLDPQKDHETFFAAAKIVAGKRADVAFVLCGEGIEAANARLKSLIEGAGLGSRVRLLGECADVAAITAALDVAVSSSAYGEGFSNTLGEALACAVPAVATDVGDSAAIVGAEGRIVPPRDPEALAAAILDVLAMPEAERRDLGARGRARMAREYSIAAVAERYRRLYDDVLGR